MQLLCLLLKTGGAVGASAVQCPVSSANLIAILTLTGPLRWLV